MWKPCLTLLLVAASTIFANARADDIPRLETRWQAVWVDGFEPDDLIYRDVPFDWTKAGLTTRANDPGNWRSFSAGCNAAYRQKVSRRTQQYAHGEWLQIQEWQAGMTQMACLERTPDSTQEFASRAMALEGRLMELILNCPDKRCPYKIDSSGQLIWMDEYGHDVARFKRRD